MSYLSDTRLHFSGYFQSDVSTVNNDVRHFDSEKFLPSYQKMETQKSMNGWWNPEGGAAFRFVQCQVTGGVLNGRPITTSEEDPVIGKLLMGADGRVAGKMVDLDPQQQSVSEIWGFQLRLGDAEGQQYLKSEYSVSAFMDLWRRQQGGAGGGDQTLASYYTSVLENLDWNNHELQSELLQTLIDQCEGKLSISFNVFGYNMDATSADFTLGRIVGTIGPAFTAEPDRFIFGRHMMATMSSGPVNADQNVYNFPGQVNEEKQTVSIDLGNCLPLSDGEGSLVDVGDLSFGLLKDENIDNGAIISEGSIAILGEIPYRERGWYAYTAGVVDFSYADNKWVSDHINERPLALVRRIAGGRYQIMVRESIDGVYVRADQYVFRLNPADKADVEFYASRYGRPLKAEISLAANNSMIGGGGSGKPLNPPVKIPDVGIPVSAIGYADAVLTDESGRATLCINASEDGPDNPRGYIDGQLYGVGYQLKGQPDGYHANPWLFVSCLLWDKINAPKTPTWYDDIQPILQQYGNLYPIMSKHLVDLADYDSVVKHKSILQLAFSLPVSDPNYMPVTRDLSEAKRKMIVDWFKNTDDSGIPLKGEPSQGKKALPAAAILDLAGEVEKPDRADVSKADVDKVEAPLGGKTSFLNNLPSNKN